MVLFTCVSMIYFRCLRSIAASFSRRIFQPNVDLQHLAQDFIASKLDNPVNVRGRKRRRSDLAFYFQVEVTMASGGTGFAFGNLQRFNDSTGRQPWPMPAHAASRTSDRAVFTTTP